ncbi:tyrosine-protein phosphatase [Rhodococcus sp. IEGM 1305]|uniref:tyrosine-protein phosphatase n=1 Tax=Rhodococcus sp. IEGM 1305 TaxID=3047092 RepID=UPI0024B74435|nr:tyrosine-protein phosphatase [Rhodococcus sp. IEGM 1305]MDI9953636.1 tyrosine-protein phosphatase [Rhodococcus sp. IEGM 1305]
MPSTNSSHSARTPGASIGTPASGYPGGPARFTAYTSHLCNARDLGGLPTTSGTETVHTMLIRSANPCLLTAAEVDLLVDGLGIRTRIDLRAPRETIINPGSWTRRPDVNSHDLPFAEIEPPGEGGDPAEQIASSYLIYLLRSIDAVIRGIELIARHDAAAVLIHCAGGKDRTGIMVACLLDVLGVEHRSIVEDYARSANELARTRRELARLTLYQQRIGAIADRWGGAAPEVMSAFLRRLGAEHGGSAALLRAHGLSSEMVDALRSRYLTTTMR